MIPIFIDTRSISEQFPLFPEDVRDLLDFTVKSVAQNFAKEWQDEALRSLGSTRADYAKNIVLIDEGFARGAVVLTGWLPNAIESGISPFDMKAGLLHGPKAKKGANGVMYNTIPFRLGNPEALSESAMFSAILPEPVYDAIQEKSQNIPTSGGIRTEGLKPSEIPTTYREPVVRKAPSTPTASFKDYKHKSSIFQGVSKVKDSVTGQNRYVSFRRVSENSDPDSWIHKGIDAHNLSNKALESMQMDHIVGSAIDQFLTQKGLV